MFVVGPATTLLYPSGPVHDVSRHHLFVVLAGPYGPPQQVLMVPICTIRSNSHDATCVLRKGEHVFIQHDSYVAYNLCRVEPVSKLLNGVHSNLFVDKGPIGEGIYWRIVNGLRKSPFTKPFAKDFFTEWDKQFSEN